MKIKFKITALFALLVTIILLVLSISVHYFTSLQRIEAFKKRLKGRANNDGQLFSYFGDSDSTRSILYHIDSASAFTLNRKSVVIFNYLDKPVYNYNANNIDSILPDKDILKQARLRKEVYYAVNKRDILAFHYTDNRSRIVVVVAGYDVDGWQRLKDLRDILLTCLFIGIAIALVVGYAFSVQLVKPIKQIINDVKHITSQNLSHHIQAGSTQDELNQLANTFNELLDRLQESFIIQRRFISNASHELSTPLTAISSQLDVTLQKERSTEEYKQVIQSVHEDVQQMQQLTKSLLEIAKTGTQGSIELSEVRIDEVLLKVTADVQKNSEEYRVILQFGDFPDDEKAFLVFGNIDLLYSSLRNIADNGCKFSFDHQVMVNLMFENDNVIVQFKNFGDTITEDETEHIFQPFYRSANASPIKGFGLGLALAQRIINLHKGIIKVQSSKETGTLFTIILPSLKKFAAKL
ncbi:HAMP domain-containing sensor histidine kinase [Longitalea arenae]|uniref:HAMP domain-containing sensor histidine kinase n=1 Tax=Longitalea arenae TaxID=2812558 RepID=UPI0019687163|nr:HAMP domain-containing sensor histidine kinase [Longitalea arenae]